VSLPEALARGSAQTGVEGLLGDFALRFTWAITSVFIGALAREFNRGVALFITFEYQTASGFDAICFHFFLQLSAQSNLILISSCIP